MTNELYHYNHNHDALGRFAKSSGVSRSERLGKRKERLENRSMKYEARIVLDKEKLSRPSSLRRDAKVAKLERKKNRYAPRAAKAQKRLANGKDISNRQAKAMLKTQQLEGKIAKADKKNSKTRARIAKNELRNARVEKRIARVSKMQVKAVRKENIQAGRSALDNEAMKKYMQKAYKELGEKNYDDYLVLQGYLSSPEHREIMRMSGDEVLKKTRKKR